VPCGTTEDHAAWDAATTNFQTRIVVQISAGAVRSVARRASCCEGKGPPPLLLQCRQGVHVVLCRPSPAGAPSGSAAAALAPLVARCLSVPHAALRTMAGRALLAVTPSGAPATEALAALLASLPPQPTGIARHNQVLALAMRHASPSPHALAAKQ